MNAFSSTITKRNRPKKIWVDKGTEIAGAFQKFCNAEWIQIYCTMSETKAAFAERTIRSLKNILYRYMDDYGYKYIHKLPQFITTLNSRRNSSIDMRANTVKNCNFMSIYIKTAAKSVGRQTLREQLGSGSRKPIASRVIPKNLQNKSFGPEETFLQTIFINHVEYFSVPIFCGSFWISRRESPSY